MEIKGVAADSLPLFFLVAMSPLLVVSVMGMVESMSVQAGYAIDDLRMTSRADSVKGSYIYDYSTLGAEYSVNQKSRELGLNGGNQEWTAENLENGEITKQKLMEGLERRSEEYFEQKYARELSPAGCNIERPVFDLKLEQRQNGINGSLEPQETVEIECVFEKGNVTVEIKQSREIGFRVEQNRYGNLSESTIYALTEIKNDWEDMEKSYSGEAYACSDTSGLEQDAEDNAAAKAERSLENTAEDAYSSSDLQEGIETDSQDYSLEEYTEVSDSGPTASGTCSCSCELNNACIGESPPDACGEGSCSSEEIEICDTQYKATSTIEADQAKASITLREKTRKILMEGGYRVLKFRVSDYIQNFD